MHRWHSLCLIWAQTMSTVAISTPSAPASARRSALWKSLFGQVSWRLLLGVIVGFAWPEFAVKLKPLGDAFIKLIKMIIPVLVFCVVVHGIAGAGDLKRVGRVGVKALIYFEVVTTIALALGLVLAFVFQPGVGMNVDPKALDAKAMSAYAENASKLTGGGTVDFLMKLIPTTVVDAFATGDVLQVLLFAVLFGCALAMLGERGAPVADLHRHAAATCCSRPWASSSSWRRWACWAPSPSRSASTASAR